MADLAKLLGQNAPAATTETDLYTVPGATNTTVSTIIVCNRGATAATFRISIADGGGATTNKDYLYYDLPLAANDSYAATLGITLEATDKVKVYASTANLSFNLFGVESA